MAQTPEDVARTPEAGSEGDPLATRSSEAPGAPTVPSRYGALVRVAEGGQAEVWRAVDQLDGGSVAIKRYRRVSPRDLERFRREVAALRQADLPGVVRLVDYGVTDDGRPWTATRWVEGRPFPGVGVPVPWATLAPLAAALLTTLARLHDAGLVHRDLKPDNVLVDPEGRPVVLDFGLARGEALGGTLTLAGAPLGTPRYMAPEQARGRKADRRADLYAVGVLLYEALTGTIPHAHEDWRALIDLRATRPAPPLRCPDPALPRGVAAAVDRLLALEPHARPPDARAALAELAGDTGGVASRPWLGERAPVREAVDRLLAGETAGVAGPAGSGKSRFVAEVEAELGARGRPCLRVGPGVRPFDSLLPVLGPLGVRSSDEVDALLGARLEAALAHAVVVVDPLDAVDPWSRRLLLAARGPVLVSRGSPDPGDHALPAWTADTVAPLFVGPERLFHLRTDAAARVVRRAGGWPGAIFAELDRWVSAGLARWEGERVRIDRFGLERVARGQAGYPTRLTEAADPALDELLAWIHLAGDAADVDTLARARGEAAWQVELEVRALAEVGAVARTGDRLEARQASGVLATWDLDAHLGARARLADALPPGAPGRLGHLVVSGREAEAAAEAWLVGERAWREGRVTEAFAAFAEGVRVAPLAAVPALARGMAGLVVEEGAPALLARARDALGRADGVPDEVVDVVQAAVLLARGEPSRAAGMVEGSLPGDPGLGAAWWAVRVGVGRALGPAAWEEALRAAEAWAAGADEGARALVSGWRATRWYTEGRLWEAAEAAERAARGATTAGLRLDAWFRAASAWIELAEVGRTRSAAEALLAEARERRLVRAEARAEWVFRSLVNRQGATEVDEELVEAAAELDAPGIRGTLLLVEAACAWRGGALARAAQLALAAEEAFAGGQNRPAELFARALRYASVAPEAGAVERLAEELHALGRPDVSAEGLVLLTRAGLDSPAWTSTIQAAITTAPPVPAGWRRGVLPYPLMEPR